MQDSDENTVKSQFLFGSLAMLCMEQEVTARMTEVIEKKDVAVISDKSR